MGYSMVMIPKLYTRPTRASCRMLKNYLDRRGVEYELIDVDQHPEKFTDVMTFSNATTVPQLAVGMTVVVGLNLPRIIELLDL